jgi:glucose-6-phosphate isomerase/transaldolase/glucose-6-phosphate isomerase
VLDGFKAQGHLPEVADADDDALRALLADAAPPHYVAVLGYLAPSDAFDEAVVALRETLRAKTGAAVTFGYGPRFQHSTGQMHKGGPPVGRFLQLVADTGDDVDIPGEDYSFRTLKHAAATGDLQTLRDHGLAAERVTLEGDPVAALNALRERIEAL